MWVTITKIDDINIRIFAFHRKKTKNTKQQEKDFSQKNKLDIRNFRSSSEASISLFRFRYEIDTILITDEILR